MQIDLETGEAERTQASTIVVSSQPQGAICKARLASRRKKKRELRAKGRTVMTRYSWPLSLAGKPQPKLVARWIAGFDANQSQVLVSWRCTFFFFFFGVASGEEGGVHAK